MIKAQKNSIPTTLKFCKQFYVHIYVAMNIEYTYLAFLQSFEDAAGNSNFCSFVALSACTLKVSRANVNY